jgi:hypothetical protein
MFMALDYTLLDRDHFDDLARFQLRSVPCSHRKEAQSRTTAARASAVRADLKLGNDWASDSVATARHAIWQRAVREAGLCWQIAD